jgi:hypothetical protein
VAMGMTFGLGYWTRMSYGRPCASQFSKSLFSHLMTAVGPSSARTGFEQAGQAHLAAKSPCRSWRRSVDPEIWLDAIWQSAVSAQCADLTGPALLSQHEQGARTGLLAPQPSAPRPGASASHRPTAPQPSAPRPSAHRPTAPQPSGPAQQAEPSKSAKGQLGLQWRRTPRPNQLEIRLLEGGCRSPRQRQPSAHLLGQQSHQNVPNLLRHVPHHSARHAARQAPRSAPRRL